MTHRHKRHHHHHPPPTTHHSPSVTAHIISDLKSQMPSFMGQKKKQEQLLGDLGGVFRAVMKQDVLSPGDFPDVNDMRNKVMMQGCEKQHCGKCF
jgi:EH domain-containing protein 1